MLATFKLFIISDTLIVLFTYLLTYLVYYLKSELANYLNWRTVAKFDRAGFR